MCKQEAWYAVIDNPWFRVYLQSCALAVEASLVIALRLQKIALGGYAAEREVYRMVNEKAVAVQATQGIMLQGGPQVTAATMSKAVKHYRGKVAANRRRLTK